MNRNMLKDLLMRHVPFYNDYSPYGRTPWGCNCGRDFALADEWARHVVDAIYPES